MSPITPSQRGSTRVRITMTLQIVDEVEPRNLVVPFSLELTADAVGVDTVRAAS